MFFILSKFLAFLLQPLLWIAVLLVYGWLTRDEKRKRRCLTWSLALLLVLSNRFVFDECMRVWEVKAVPEKSLKTYDAAIVLGGLSSWDDDLQRIQFNRAGDRLMQAIALYKKGIVKTIVFTGGSGSVLHPEYKEGERVLGWLRTIGIPDSAIVIENESKNTHENATFTKAILDKRYPKGGRYLLVSSGFHLRRARACFEKAGFGTLDVFSTDRFSGPRKFEFEYAFIPDASTLDDWSQLLHELLGMITYKMAGYA